MRSENISMPLVLSSLGHTWIFDLDGTVVKHNGYRLDGEDSLLDGAAEFFANLPAEDFVLFVTSREKERAPETERFLQKHGVRYNAVVYGVPYGERILVNDRKPSGLKTAFAVNTDRNRFLRVKYTIDKEK